MVTVREKDISNLPHLEGQHFRQGIFGFSLTELYLLININLADPSLRVEDVRTEAKTRALEVKTFHENLMELRRHAITPLALQYPATFNRTIFHTEEAKAAFPKQQSKTYLTAEQFYSG